MRQDWSESSMKPVSTFTKDIIRPQMNSPDVDRDIGLQKMWIAVAGEMAPYAHPVLQRSGRMVIVCKSSVWATNLRSQAPTIQKQFREHGFPVKEIVVRVSPAKAKQNQPQPVRRAKHVIPISNNAARQIQQTACLIENPPLKAALERLAQSALRKLADQ